MMLRTTVVSIALGLALAPGAVRAESPLDKVEAGAFLGFHIWSEDNQLGRDSAMQDPIGNSFVLGLRGAYRAHPMVSGEAELAYLPASTVKYDGGVTVIGFRLEGIVHPKRFMENKLEPYGALGFGSSSTFSSGRYVTDETDLALHFGGGANYFLGTDYGLTADLKLVIAPSVTGSATLDAEVSVGFFKRFGKPPVVATSTTTSPTQIESEAAPAPEPEVDAEPEPDPEIEMDEDDEPKKRKRKKKKR